MTAEPDGVNYRLGKAPARPGAYGLRLTDYLPTIPPAPAVFGHHALVRDYGVLGNDRAGDCVWAGQDHAVMIWTAEGAHPATFTTANALADYSAATGYNPNDPASDRGTDMETAAKYFRKVGVIDVHGTRHTVDAYLGLPGVSARGTNRASLPDTLASAAWLFGAVGIGIEFPDTAMDQFNNGKPWDVVAGARNEGGHYVPIVGRVANGNLLAVTWGKLQEVTPAFLVEYCDEAVAYISLERLTDGKTLDGFNIDALRADLAALGQAATPTPVPRPAPTSPLATARAVLDPWAAARHSGTTATAANAWKTYSASQAA